MPYTTSQLISRAYFLSGIVRKDLETVSGQKLTEGLELLNELLDVKSANQRLIPYFKNYEFSAVPGQEEYFVPDLVLCETLTFYINNVRYSMFSQQRKDYFGSSRAENVTSLPYDWHIERCLNGSNLYIYFLPDSNYPMSLWGKFSLEEVTLFQDLLLTYDRFYLVYLRYALAEYICQEYNFPFQPQNEKKLTEYENILIDISPMDMTLVRRSVFNQRSNINYGIANLSNGWTTPY